MKIAAVCTAYHDDDILPWTIEHLRSQGVDWIGLAIKDLVSSDLGFAPSLGAIPIWIDDLPFHDQPYWINRLAEESEADWILPFDADEFLYAPDPTATIRDVLEQLAPNVAAITMPSFKHRDWHYREVGPTSMAKVAYRYDSNVKVGPGNHTLTGLPEGSLRTENALMIREIQYRSFEHFSRKVAERKATIDPSFGPEMGHHILQHAGKSEKDLRKAWDQMMTIPTVWDPIPSPINPPEHLAPELKLTTMHDLFNHVQTEPNDFAGHVKRVAEIVRETGTNHVIECGTCTGTSTIAFLSTGVHVYSCDLSPVRVRPEVRMAPNWTFHLGSDLEWDPDPCLVIFIDTTHTYRQTLDELKHYWPKVLPGGCLIMHDTTSYFDEYRAISHWLHTVDDVARIEAYEHSNGLGVYWKAK